MADLIQASENFESLSFRHHCSTLFDVIGEPDELAVRLFSANLLPTHTKAKIHSTSNPSNKITELLNSIEIAIRLDPQNFYLFLDQLEILDSKLKDFCDKLRFTCGVQNRPCLSTTTTTITTVLDPYRQFLKDRYQQVLPDDDKLLFTASKHYIKLALVNKESIISKQADPFTMKSLHGLTEEIMRKKSFIPLEDMLTVKDGKPAKLVLLEGAPGIGKSTLAWELCHKWEKLECVKQYNLVILVSLREKNAQEAHSLEDIFPRDTTCSTTNMKMTLDAMGRGKGVLIVLDGFDELPLKQRQKNSVYINLLKGKYLPEATIIVTSRPSVRADLFRHCQHNIDKHIEVMGFTEESIKQFAKSVFSGDILTGFLTYITSNPPIHSMMYIPLNANIIALIYQDRYNTDTPFPTTMTQLFDALTRALIRRHLASTHQVSSEYCMPPSLLHKEDISKLPPLVGEQFYQLIKKAYESMHSKEFIFTDLSEDFEHLGIMNKTTSLDVCIGPKCSYSFFHLTLQEYLAALHIAIANPGDLRLLDSLGDVVVKFLAGIFKHNDYHDHPKYEELLQLLASKIQAQDCKLLVCCAFEFPGIMHSVIMRHDKDGVVEVEPALGFDCYATGYCINQFDVNWKLHINGLKLTEKGMDHLLKGLKSSSVAKGKVQHLYIKSLSFSDTFCPIEDFCQLDSLVLWSVNINHADEVVLRRLMHSTRSRLTKLDYEQVGQSFTKTFIPLLFRNSSIQELKLNVRLNGHGNISYLLPPGNKNLKRLIITRNLLHLLAKLITCSASITYLEVSNPNSIDLSILADIVKSHQTLEVLHVGHIAYHDVSSTDTSTKMLKLIETANNSHLKWLVVMKTNFDKLQPHIHERYKHLLKPLD